MRKQINRLAAAAASVGLAIALTGGLVTEEDAATAVGGTTQAGDATRSDEPRTMDLSGIQLDPSAPPTGPAVVLDGTGDADTAWISDFTASVNDSAGALACDWYRLAMVAGGNWHESVSGCSLVGTTNDSWHGYQWFVDGTGGSACVHGRGYQLIGGSWTPNWVPLGCGREGSGQVTIGKVYTVAKVRGLTWDSFVTGVRWR